MRSTGPGAAAVSPAVNVVLVSPEGTDSGPRRVGCAVIGAPRTSAARPGGRFERPAPAYAFARCGRAWAASGTGLRRRGVRARRPEPASRAAMSAGTAATHGPQECDRGVLECESLFLARAPNVLPSQASRFSPCPTPRRLRWRLTRWPQRILLYRTVHDRGHCWSCRESNPTLYQGFCRLNCGFVPSRSGSVPFVTCGFVLGS